MGSENVTLSEASTYLPGTGPHSGPMCFPPRGTWRDPSLSLAPSSVLHCTLCVRHPGRHCRCHCAVGRPRLREETHLCRPALRPRCGHSCSDPRGSGDSPSGPALHLRTPHHPSTQALSLGQIAPLLGRPAPPHSPAPGRPQLHHAGPIRRHTQSPSAHRATPPADLHNRGDPRPGAAALWGWTGTVCEAAGISGFKHPSFSI